MGTLHSIYARFAAFLATGAASFCIGFAFLYLLYGLAGVPYLVAVPLSAIVAATAHYQAVRLFVFRNHGRAWLPGYVTFMGITAAVIVFITAGVYFSVEFLHMNVYVARVSVATLAAIASFFAHRHHTFPST